jgi:hypothetical protein
LLVRLGFFREVGSHEEFGDLLFLASEDAEVGNALELFGAEDGLGIAGEDGFLAVDEGGSEDSGGTFGEVE